jgi:hypothetical protein
VKVRRRPDTMERAASKQKRASSVRRRLISEEAEEGMAVA